MKRAFLALLLALALACSRGSIDRDHWQRMSPNEKQLYVRSLLGHEKVKDRKGGNDLVFTHPVTEYVTRIDAAYARGEQRNVDVVFEEMGARK